MAGILILTWFQVGTEWLGWEGLMSLELYVGKSLGLFSILFYDVFWISLDFEIESSEFWQAVVIVQCIFRPDFDEEPNKCD